MFDEMAVHNTQINNIKDQIDRLKWHTPAKRNSKPMDSLKLIKTSMKAFQPQADEKEPNARDAATLAQLQTLYESVESKLLGKGQNTACDMFANYTSTRRAA